MIAKFPFDSRFRASHFRPHLGLPVGVCGHRDHDPDADGHQVAGAFVDTSAYLLIRAGVHSNTSGFLNCKYISVSKSSYEAWLELRGLTVMFCS